MAVSALESVDLMSESTTVISGLQGVSHSALSRVSKYVVKPPYDFWHHCIWQGDFPVVSVRMFFVADDLIFIVIQSI